MPYRRVIAQHPAHRDDIADLVTRRPLPGPGLPHLDPFLFLNHHGPQVYPPDNRGLPFGPHPHRGFETVTFILAGALAHSDSGGHESVIDAGGVQWMTAGRGLVHAELSPEAFRRGGGPLEILQLWVNLPARLKMTAPRYVGLQREDIPAVDADDGRVCVRLVSGRFHDISGPVKPLVDVAMAVVELREGGRVVLPAPRTHTVFLYVVRGALHVGGTPVRPHHLVALDDGADEVELHAQGEASVLFGHAEPFAEPIVAHGPFVMNTAEEIREAVRDYQAGRFDAVPD
ncbi:pirin family protein [Coralloluteibacterium stylophorae]|uniref:Pirin family protein n=1 Tax=Coralloluteibacterium stylophorae TaxID=1776034 RepID=A0A8J7VQI4_9GAMM|nr:pirin family protein [Coralloluteibacterium stylophorae]MBS7455531.1 pirin family protein [Coralloluteibacterium stylophorae]